MAVFKNMHTQYINIKLFNNFDDLEYCEASNYACFMATLRYATKTVLTLKI